jgi:hypothetical protein
MLQLTERIRQCSPRLVIRSTGPGNWPRATVQPARLLLPPAPQDERYANDVTRDLPDAFV